MHLDKRKLPWKSSYYVVFFCGQFVQVIDFARFESTAEDLQSVLTSYREAFGSLFGLAFKRMSNFSIE